jgi:hypothetical protein
MTYNLPSGYTVRTTKVDSGTEFETRNPAGEVIASVIHGREDARELVLALIEISRR